LPQGLPAVFFIHRFYGGVADWRTCPPSFWRGVLGKSGCCEEKSKPLIIHGAGEALYLVSPETRIDLE